MRKKFKKQQDIEFCRDKSKNSSTGSKVNLPENAPDSGEEQLQMVLSGKAVKSPPVCKAPAGYEVRTYSEGDEQEYIRLMQSAGFEGWDSVDEVLIKALPDGIFFAVDKASGRFAATACAIHRPTSMHPAGGVLGWVAVCPEHRGKNLGYAVCAAAVRRLISAGYSRIYLLSDDFRISAISLYKKMGFVPFIFSEEMKKRWAEVEKLLR